METENSKLEKYWPQVSSTFAAAQKSSMHCSIASVDQQGMPNITPIGTVFLKDNYSLYFFDSFTSKLAENVKANQQVCVSAVNSKQSFWLKSMFKGRFTSPPGVRLYGEITDLREASEDEKQVVAKRIKALAWTKGSKLIWSDFTHVREVKINDIRPVSYPKMIEGLWPDL